MIYNNKIGKNSGFFFYFKGIIDYIWLFILGIWNFWCCEGLGTVGILDLVEIEVDERERELVLVWEFLVYWMKFV